MKELNNHAKKLRISRNSQFFVIGIPRFFIVKELGISTEKAKGILVGKL